MAGVELERLARIMRAYEWTDHRAKVARKEAQITKWEHQVGQVLPRKERAIREVDIPEENRVDVQAQCDREIKMGEKVTRMGEDANELEKFMIKLRTQEGNVRD
jgi:structural maintenance of chromosome 2